MEIAINMVAVLVATVVVMALGALWYGPVFGKPWMGMMGFTPESMKAMKLSPALAMGIMAVLTFLMMYVLAHGIVFGNIATGMSGAAGGMTGAFWYWLGFAVPLTASSFLWEGKSLKLWVLNAGYYLVALLVAGAILGQWV